MESFSRLGLAEPLAAALDSFGFATPTPVQAQAIPMILSRRDAIIESETGTGKTFAYLAPAFQLVSVLERRGVGEPGVIVAAPTQELAVQIGRESERLAKAAGLSLRTVVLLGGTALERQAVKLKAKPEIVVGTLGRLADLVSLGKLRTTALKLLVLDEADRLFANETEELARALLKSAPSSSTRVLVSATIPERIRRELRPLLRDAVEISPTGEAVLSGSIEHWCFYCDGRKRLDFARRFEAAVRPERCLVFLSMATRVEKAALGPRLPRPPGRRDPLGHGQGNTPRRPRALRRGRRCATSSRATWAPEASTYRASPISSASICPKSLPFIPIARAGRAAPERAASA